MQQRAIARRGGAPLVPPVLFARRSFAAGTVAVLVFYATVASFFLIIALYLQDGRGLSALDSGLIFSLLGVGFLGASVLAGGLAARLGRRVLALGTALRAVALLGLWLVVGHVGSGGSVAWLVAPLLLDGVGMGLVMGPLVGVVLQGVDAEHAGAASGVLAAAQQVGNAIGIAVVGVLFFGALDGGHTVAHAFRAGLLDVALLCVAVSALVALLPPGRRAG